MKNLFWIANVCLNPVSEHTAFLESSKLIQEEQVPHRKENKSCWSNLLR